jgi:hypothetical protein
VTDILGRDGLIEPSPVANVDAPVGDLTREPLNFPADRDLRLQNLARADEGFLLALGYSSQRGYGRNHPFAGEIRFGEVEVEFMAEDAGFAVPYVDKGTRQLLPEAKPGPVVRAPHGASLMRTLLGERQPECADVGANSGWLGGTNVGDIVRLRSTGKPPVVTISGSIAVRIVTQRYRIIQAICLKERRSRATNSKVSRTLWLNCRRAGSAALPAERSISIASANAPRRLK